MSQTRTLGLSLLALIVLNGCAASYSTTLEQQMDGMPPSERRKVLAKECGNEIAKSLKKDDASSAQHANNMKYICEKMTGQTVKAVFPENKD